MKRTFIALLIALLAQLSAVAQDGRVITFSLDAGKEPRVEMYWKGPGGVLSTFGALKAALAKKGRKLIMAVNGGMYMEDQSPLGLFIEKGKLVRKLNTRTGKGNFYLQPNGVFYVMPDGRAGVMLTADWEWKKPKARYATQSGPMLLIQEEINPNFTKGSQNLNIRNGVGIRPDGGILFAISKEPINFYDFAKVFRDFGCVNALYLDGAISGMWTPTLQTGLQGGFGVLIGVVK